MTTDGQTHNVLSNRIQRSGENGLWQFGDGFTTALNNVQDSGNVGILVGATSAGGTVRENTVKRSKIDICDDGANANITNNKPASSITIQAAPPCPPAN